MAAINHSNIKKKYMKKLPEKSKECSRTKAQNVQAKNLHENTHVYSNRFLIERN